MRTRTLHTQAIQIVKSACLDEKVRLSHETAKLWYARKLSIGSLHYKPLPERPGRPDKPELLPPREMPKRSRRSGNKKIALIHALAHIELNAIDLTWDLVARFVEYPMPRSFFDNWVQVGLEEAKHFQLLSNRLVALGSEYGAMPAHDGLWQACHETGHDLLARLAIIPLVLEARGLDISPKMIMDAEEQNDDETAQILKIIYRDEKRHVLFGARWFRFLCDRERIRPETTYRKLVRQYFRGQLKPPFNDRARAASGLTEPFYKPLSF